MAIGAEPSRAGRRNSAAPWSAPTVPSHSFIATPFGNGAPVGSSVWMSDWMVHMSLVPGSQLARSSAAKGPVLNHA